MRNIIVITLFVQSNIVHFIYKQFYGFIGDFGA